MKSWLGTSGFQYPEWKGKFYPEKLSTAKMLAFYGERFSSTESNYTFRHLPSAKSIERWARETPGEFRFSFKAPQRVTHFAKLQDCQETVAAFDAALSGMGEKRGAVLFQLPATFKKDAPRLADFLATLPEGFRPAFEFRHASWFDDEIYGVLRGGKAALCWAESEELSTPPVVTADFGYLRLRREDYAPEDLQKWAELALAEKKQWKDVFVYFKHEETGVGPVFGAQMQELLGADGRPSGKRP